MTTKDDFTLKMYRNILNTAKEKFKFVTYTYRPITETENIVYWRHDIDFSIEDSLAMAIIENEVGVNSTYLLNLHSEFYNSLEVSQISLLRRIIEIGHNIGIHLDHSFYGITCEKQLEEAIEKEKTIFREILNIEVDTFSFHNPTPEILKFQKLEYSGLINTYSSFFVEKTSYCSDSNGTWKELSLSEFIKVKNGPIQVLTHPGWWTEDPIQTEYKIFNIINMRCNKSYTEYLDTLSSFKRLKRPGIFSAFDKLAMISKAQAIDIEMDWIRGKTKQVAVSILEMLPLLKQVKHPENLKLQSLINDLNKCSGSQEIELKIIEIGEAI